jgi:hypothetical protein
VRRSFHPRQVHIAHPYQRDLQLILEPPVHHPHSTGRSHCHSISFAFLFRTVSELIAAFSRSSAGTTKIAHDHSSQHRQAHATAAAPETCRRPPSAASKLHKEMGRDGGATGRSCERRAQPGSERDAAKPRPWTCPKSRQWLNLRKTTAGGVAAYIRPRPRLPHGVSGTWNRMAVLLPYHCASGSPPSRFEALSKITQTATPIGEKQWLDSVI